MSTSCRKGWAAALAGVVALAGAAHAAAPRLVVCADPANLPYSDAHRPGFENKVAAIIAADMGVSLETFWYAEHRGFLRRGLNDGNCDMVVSVPVGIGIVATTKPWFTSGYVAVMRAKDTHRFTGFDDAWLKDARIGLQLVGGEGAGTPPANALGARGIVDHITGFAMWAEAGVQDPQGRIVDAVARGEIDVAFVWGPFAGWFAKSHGAALRVTPIDGDPKAPDMPFTFAMAVGVRKADTALRDRIQQALDRRRAEIGRVLAEYAIPTLPARPAAPSN